MSQGRQPVVEGSGQLTFGRAKFRLVQVGG